MSNNGILRTAHVSGLLRRMYDAAVASAQPDLCVARHLPEPPKGRTVVIGVGKAAAAMAKAVEAHWQGPLSGVVVVPAGASLPLRHIRVMVGSHPVPDQSSVDGARALMQAVAGLTPDDLVIALVSGGGSALCALPAQGLTLEDKQEVTRALLLRGAPINEINTVRRHLSAIKGGRLAAAAFPARVVTLLISDIPGDDPALIASGPTLPDTSTCADALEILQRYEITTRPAVVQALEAGLWESVKPDNARLTGHKHLVVASAWTGLQAAALLAQSEGWACHILSDAMEGEARELAKAHAALALSVAQRDQPFSAPCILLSGGEATVTVHGDGRGGRNTEFVLAMALALEGRTGADRIFALSAGTDGLDGRSGAAGAWMGPDTLQAVSADGQAARQAMANNDSAPFLRLSSALIAATPTFTNINDFRAIAIT